MSKASDTEASKKKASASKKKASSAKAKKGGSTKATSKKASNTSAAKKSSKAKAKDSSAKVSSKKADSTKSSKAKASAKGASTKKAASSKKAAADDAASATVPERRAEDSGAAPSSVFVVASEGATGKSTVALGLLRFLAGKVQRVGVFRPIAPCAEGERDEILEVLQQHTNVDIPYEDCIGVSGDLFHANPEQRIDEIVQRYHAVADQCDAVVVLGSDYTGVAYPPEFDVNARIATNLGIAVLLVVKSFGRTPAEIAGNAEISLQELRNHHAHPVALVANRCDPGAVEDIETALGSLDMPVWAVPEDPVLVAPTMGELMEALDGEFHAGDPALLDREAMHMMVGGMTADRILARLKDGQVVIIPADRTDAVLAVASAHNAEGFPSLAGMVWNGGVEPSEELDRLITGLKPSMPIIKTPHGTYESASIAASTRGRINSSSGRKVEAALSLMEKYVDTSELLQRLQVRIPDVITPQMFEYRLLEQARSDRRHIVLPEGTDDRILHAAGRLMRREVAKLTILGDSEAVAARAEELGIDLGDATILDPATSKHLDKFAKKYAKLRKHKGVTLEQAREKVSDISYFGTMMVLEGMADGMVSGAAHTTAHTIRPSLEVIKTKPGVSTVSSVFFMCLADHVLAFADCAVVPDPSAAQLADIAVSSAETASQFGISPRVAMLSYSTGDSGSGEDVEKVREGTSVAEKRLSGIPVEGPIQFDAAVDPVVAQKKAPGSDVAGQATVLIFPDLNTGNNTYKAVQRTAGAVAIGPVLQGLNKPINDLSRGALVEDIVNTVAITAIQAQKG